MIEINELTFSYKKHNVFENLSITFEDGKIYGLLGLNGAGKSTLLYLMSGLLFPHKGSIKFNNYDMQKRNPNALADLFFVPEEFDLPNMKFETFVNLNSPFYPKFNRETFMRCLRGFEVDINCNLNKLSMGQKKKAFMCFALATNTSLLIMDEPTNGLDIPSKSQFRQVVSSCMDDNRTIIISTHQVRDVENLIDHISIINNSKLIFNEPISKITEKLIFRDFKLNQLPENMIYSQTYLGGELGVCKKMIDDEETPLDIELLFNAVLCQPDKINQVFAN
ncbi:MAG: ATP-binding cassette domain-containing protein [Bacteroidales bacterium]|nr:ATP-binding cassette domain-containing protein [Bacteroidales bacterium]